MTATANCPACGAILIIDPDASEMTCPYCGNHFDVDLSGAASVLRKAGSPAGQRSEQVADRPLLEEAPASSIDPGEPAASGPEHESVVEPFGRPFSTDLPLQPLTRPPTGPTSNRLAGWRLPVLIGLVFLAAFCLSCICLLIAVERTVK